MTMLVAEIEGSRLNMEILAEDCIPTLEIDGNDVAFLGFYCKFRGCCDFGDSHWHS